MPTTAMGYGGFIIDRYTEADGPNSNGELQMYHMVSSWIGKSNKNRAHPYGVFPRRLALCCDPEGGEIDDCRENPAKHCNKEGISPPWPPIP